MAKKARAAKQRQRNLIKNIKNQKRQSKLWLQKDNSNIKKIRTNNKQKESTKVSSKIKNTSKELFKENKKILIIQGNCW